MSTLLTALPDDGTRGPRLEIDEFCGDNEVTNLFLIALAELQANPVTQVNGQPNWMNFYGIAGIHGQPSENWGGSGTKPTRGYCHHSLSTFPTWHRPYIFLLELSLYQEMKKQAGKYKTNDLQNTYKAAAERFRLPFWDIVMPRYPLASAAKLETVWGCPAILKAKEVYVKKPVPSKDADAQGFEKISNPLFSFSFPSEDDIKQANRASLSNMNPKTYNRNQTARIPDGKGATQTGLLDLAIQRQASARATLIWQMLNPDLTASDMGVSGPKASAKILDARSWETFGNRAMGNKIFVDGITNPFSIPSLESWHDGIHVLMGTGQYYSGLSNPDGFPENSSPMSGQMGDPAWAAFDPIFFLHHCNIDRMLALFQALWPGKYVAPTDDGPLYPFRSSADANGYYNSANLYIKNYWNAGFAVPGNTAPKSPVAPETIQAVLKKYLSDTYYWATNNVVSGVPLANWPKDKELKASWALHGSSAVATPPAGPTLSLSALRFTDGVPELFSSEMIISDSAAVGQTVEYNDVAIEAPQVLESARTVNSMLPEGAFTVSLAAGTSSVQITWNATVKVRKFAFNRSFSVHLFIGYVKDEQPERYMTKKNEAGFTGVFVTSPDSVPDCSNCVAQREEDIVVEDVVPLTTILYDYLDAAPGSENLIRDGDYQTIADLTPESVVPFLKEQLRWRIIDLGANLLSGEEQQAGLEITVSSRQFLPPTPDNLMGVYGPETIYTDITSNKAGGYGYTY